MNPAPDRSRLRAYVDGTLKPDEAAEVERLLAQDADAMAEVVALRAEARDATFAPPHRRSLPLRAFFATLVVAAGVGIGAGWVARGAADASSAPASRDAASPATSTTESRLQAFVRMATVSHALFVPDSQHPVEVPGADQAQLVDWLSKRLGASLVVPNLADTGWVLLGGRLLPEDGGPVAQLMYQDPSGRRLTLAVSRSVIGAADRATPSAGGPSAAAMAQSAFRIADANGDTVFYWLGGDCAYALTARLKRNEMTVLASRVYRQVDRMAK